jgi:hypothetical protein
MIITRLAARAMARRSLNMQQSRPEVSKAIVEPTV